VLKDYFLTRYTTAEFLNYKNAHELFNSKQGTKSVDDICASMQRIAKRVGADYRMLRFAVLNGLRPEIANFVTQKQPTDWEKLFEAARLGEMCVATQPNTDTLVTKQLSQMQDQLRQLSIKFDTPTAAPHFEATRGKTPTQSSPRRVYFDDKNDKRSRSYDRRSNMTIAVPGQTRQKLGSEVLCAVPAQVIVGLGVSEGTIRPRPAENPVVEIVRLVGTNVDRGGPKV